MSYKNKKILRDFLLLTLLSLALGFFIIFCYAVLKTKPDTSGMQKEIVIAVEDVPYELFEDAEPHQRVLDRTHRTILGRIVSLSTKAHTYERAKDGESVCVTKEGYCDAYIRIRLDNENPRIPIGSYYIGEGIAISTPSFAADGRVFSVEGF